MRSIGILSKWKKLDLLEIVRRKNNSLNADDSQINKMVYDSDEDLLKIISSKISSNEEIKTFTAIIKEQIELFNSSGLMDASCKNRRRHTVAEL